MDLSLPVRVVALLLPVAVVGGVVFGVGALTTPRRLADSEDFDGYSVFWLGWVTLTAVLLLLHLVVPLDERVAVAALLAGSVGLAGGRSRDLRRAAFSANWLPPWPFVALILGLVLYVAAQGLLVYDHGLYHAQTVKWAVEHPAVPGLGNLHGRLAFNHGSLYLAAPPAAVLPIDVRHVLLAAPTIVALCELTSRAVGRFRPALPASRWASAVLLVPATLWAVRYAGSISPDLVVFLLEMVVFLRVMDLVRSPDVAPDRHLVVITVLSLGLVMTKPSGGVFGILMVLAATWITRDRIVDAPRLLRRAGALTAVLLIPWVVHGIVLSGYPSYPLPVLGVPVEWRIPAASVAEMSQVIRDWAVEHSGIFRLEFQVQALVALPLTASAIVMARPRRLLVVLLPAGLVWAATMLSAPDVRFLAAVPWLVGAGAAGLLCESLLARGQVAERLVGWLPIIAATTTIVLLAGQLGAALGGVEGRPWFDKPVGFPVRSLEFDGATTLQVPLLGDRAFWAELPSAPSGAVLERGLHLRDSERLRSGFRGDVPPG